MMEGVPGWMDKAFFTECLQKDIGKQDIEVTNFTVSSAAPPGNNYGSLTMRVKVEYKDSKTNLNVKSLIVKSEVIHGAIKELSASLKMIEPSFYYQFIAEAKNYTETYFVPRCLYSPRPDVTVLEDLKDKGFVMADRLKQLDFDHCRLYMIAAAAMHAVSVPIFEESPEIKDAIGGEKMFGNECDSRIMMIGLLKGGMKCLAEAMGRNERFKKYTKIIEETSPHLWDMLVEAHKPSVVLNTLNQGDPWTTNMMFKYNDEGVATEIKLLDFQGLRYGSPVNDVMYFIWSSANNEVKKNRLKELYQIYLDTLNSKLGEFKCVERMTFDQLMDNVRKLSPLTLLFAACNLPLLCWPHALDMADLVPKGGEILDTEPVLKRYFNDEFCTNYLPSLLESLEVNGIFEFLQSYIN